MVLYFVSTVEKRMFDDNFPFANRVSKSIILLQVKFMLSLGSLSSFDNDAKNKVVKTEFLFYLVLILQYSKAILFSLFLFNLYQNQYKAQHKIWNKNYPWLWSTQHIIWSFHVDRGRQKMYQELLCMCTATVLLTKLFVYSDIPVVIWLPLWFS